MKARGETDHTSNTIADIFRYLQPYYKPISIYTHTHYIHLLHSSYIYIYQFYLFISFICFIFSSGHAHSFSSWALSNSMLGDLQGAQRVAGEARELVGSGWSSWHPGMGFAWVLAW